MKIQFASDLHLEMQENSRWLKHNPLALLALGVGGWHGDQLSDLS